MICPDCGRSDVIESPGPPCTCPPPPTPVPLMLPPREEDPALSAVVAALFSMGPLIAAVVFLVLVAGVSYQAGRLSAMATAEYWTAERSINDTCDTVCPEICDPRHKELHRKKSGLKEPR